MWSDEFESLTLFQGDGRIRVRREADEEDAPIMSHQRYDLGLQHLLKSRLSNSMCSKTEVS